MTNATIEQPEPVTTEQSNLVLPVALKSLLDTGRRVLGDDLAARAELGKERYGTYLRSHNGRDALSDLYQELLDAIMYMTQCRMEGDDLDYLGVFAELKHVAMWVKRRIEMEGGNA